MVLANNRYLFLLIGEKHISVLQMEVFFNNRCVSLEFCNLPRWKKKIKPTIKKSNKRYEYFKTNIQRDKNAWIFLLSLNDFFFYSKNTRILLEATHLNVFCSPSWLNKINTPFKSFVLRWSFFSIMSVFCAINFMSNVTVSSIYITLKYWLKFKI